MTDTLRKAAHELSQPLRYIKNEILRDAAESGDYYLRRECIWEAFTILWVATWVSDDFENKHRAISEVWDEVEQ
jgi:hypothetical protein